MTVPHNADSRWKKATFSETQGACIELGLLVSGTAVRDSKNPSGPVLSLPIAGLVAFAKADRRPS